MLPPCRLEAFTTYAKSIPRLLDTLGAADVLRSQRQILIKPNLVNASPPPVTLPVAACDALVKYCHNCSDAEIVIGEGCGAREMNTDEVFRIHGYELLAKRHDLRLVDLNEADLMELQDPTCQFFPTFMMPKIVMESFLISAATLKAHSLALVSLSMKNMIGVAPPAYYQRGGHWKKSTFHQQMQTSVYELNRYRKPDLAFIDASVGLADYHLGGPTCEPPPKQLLAGFDPVAVDAQGAELLGIPWQRVGHIKMADGVLGSAESSIYE
jgi:uncharacterized protein (DUF362 family)